MTATLMAGTKASTLHTVCSQGQTATLKQRAGELQLAQADGCDAQEDSPLQKMMFKVVKAKREPLLQANIPELFTQAT